MMDKRNSIRLRIASSDGLLYEVNSLIVSNVKIVQLKEFVERMIEEALREYFDE